MKYLSLLMILALACDDGDGSVTPIPVGGDGGMADGGVAPDAAPDPDDGVPRPDAAPEPDPDDGVPAPDAGLDPDGATPDAAQPDAGMPVEDHLRTHVETLAGEIGSRSLTRMAGLNQAIDYIVGELEGMGYTVQRQEYDVRGDTATNIWVQVPGNEREDEIVVIGAHYDSVPSTPGADDNASGVAAGLELARTFANRPQAQTLHFVFFANEEPPYFQTQFMGSLVYARALAAEDAQVTSMVSLEMLGYYSDEPDSQEFPLGLAGLFPDTGNFLAFVSDIPTSMLLDEAHAAFLGSSGFPAEKLAAPGALPEAGFSDHWSFWQADYRALMVTDTAFFRNPHYHEPTDTFDTLDYVRFGELYPGLVGVVEALAD